MSDESGKQDLQKESQPETQQENQQIDALQNALSQGDAQQVDQHDPLDTHAQLFHLYTPRLRGMLNMMNKKALIRLLFSLIQFPLQEGELKTRSKLEKDAFQISDQMLTSKYLMVLGTYLQIETENAKKLETNSIEGETNGR
jgi:hypothetical protein